MTQTHHPPRPFLAGLMLLAVAGCSDGILAPDGGTDGLFASFSHAGANTVPVSDDNLGVDWLFVAETGTTGSGAFVVGPGSPHTGSGSAEFSLAAAADGHLLLGAILAATPLADIDAIEYSTYRSVGNPAWAVALQFNMNYDPATNPGNAWQGRLVFEPYHDAAVVSDAWQTWNPMAQRGWWATGAPGNGVCPMVAPCTWDEVLTAFPDAQIRDDAAPVGLKAGSGWGEFTGNVDGLTVSVNGIETTWDFGPAPTEPTTLQDCMSGGWEDYGFRNQGQCVRFVSTGKDSR